MKEDEVQVDEEITCDDDDDGGGSEDESKRDEIIQMSGGKRCEFILESSTTITQADAEDECEPFFINIRDLSASNILHLRNIGLLPPTRIEEEDDFEWSNKLQQILGDTPTTTTTTADTKDDGSSYDICLLKEKHVEYLTRALHTFGVGRQPLSSSYVSLDASRSWIMYWTLHSLDLLEALPDLDPSIFQGILHTLQHFWQENPIHWKRKDDDDDTLTKNLVACPDKEDWYVGGGFGGGPAQLAHCATTYAAILTLCILAGWKNHQHPHIAQQAQEMLTEKRWKIYVWLHSLKNETSGAFHMHQDGETDVRATYIAACVATLLNIHTSSLFDDPVTDYVASCQTYEGGFGGEPHAEAHGGYTYCAFAALQLLQATHKIDIPSLHGWLSRRQMSFEGGFSGRSNKLVDGCYSFWQGASLAIIDRIHNTQNAIWTWDYDNYPTTTQQQQQQQQQQQHYSSSWNEMMLQRYILLCAQDTHGGLRDKPSKPRDFYHSCYNLSGLSIAQQSSSSSSSRRKTYGHEKYSIVAPTHFLFNICYTRVSAIYQIFHHDPETSQK